MKEEKWKKERKCNEEIIAIYKNNNNL